MKKRFNKKKIIWIVSSSAFLFIYFSALSYLGQNYRSTDNGKYPTEKIIECNEGWKFKIGDEKYGAAIGLDDHAWMNVTSDSLPEKYHGELAWFRLHLKADSFFLQRQVVLLIDHLGASEVYLDGDKIASFGVVSDTKEKEKNFNPSGYPLNVDLQKGDSHLIALRYSNHHHAEFQKLPRHNGPGFSVTIVDHAKVMQGQMEEKFASFLGTLLGTFLLTLAFIHFLLYIFYRHAKENLFYSAFVFTYSLVFFLAIYTAATTSPYTEIYLRGAFLLVLNPFLLLSLLVFVFWIFQQKFSFGIWAACVVGVLPVLHVLTDWPGEGAYFVSLVWMAIFAVIVMVRGTWKAIKEKRPGFMILSTGVGIFALFIFLSVSMIFFASQLHIDLQFSNPILLITALIALMSIPISMSIYLAYTSSRTNRDLKSKLIEVETLSARSLEQEKEKQKILETQKETLEVQVKERTHEIVEQNKVIEEKNKDITDSLNYAKRIQEAILPSRELKKELFPESFVLFKPKDIVSGDFYWYTKAESWNERHRTDGKGKRIIASVDCTGHGVPGAFMSMIGNNLLTEIVLEKGITKPSDILDALHEGVRSSLKQNKGSETRDGMDIALCCFDPETTTIEYAGAQRPLWIIRNSDPKTIEEVKADKYSIGGLESADRKKFTNHSIALNKDDRIYIFSDGFADQFGGPDGKKFMSKRFKELLLSIAHLPMNEQEDALESAIEKWKGSSVQIDDILVIGIKS